MEQPDEKIVDTTDYDVFSTPHRENGAVLYSSENDDDARSKAKKYQCNEIGEIASSPVPTEEEPPTPNW